MQTASRSGVPIEIRRRGGLLVEEDVSRQIVGRYQLLALLGAGSAGAVWLAQDNLLKRRVALKRVERANPAGRAMQEARAAAAVHHPNTVRVHDLVCDDAAGVEWVVMEALYGRSLADVLGEEVRLGVDETCYLAPEIFDRGRYSPASDLYAMGMTLYAALSGGVPVVPTCDVDTGAWVTPEISRLPPSAVPLEAVVRGLLNPDFRQRLTGQQARRLLDRL